MIFDEMSIFPLLYLIFRLGPILIILFFVLQSFILWNMKGIVILFGLFFTFIIMYILNAVCKNFNIFEYKHNAIINPKCALINIGLNGNYYSIFPFSITIYSFIFGYLVFSLIYNNGGLVDATKLNALSIIYTPMFIIFPLFIVAEIIWIFYYSCYQFENENDSTKILTGLIFITLVISFFLGWIWSLIIDNTKITELKYISANDDNSVCSRPTKSYFRCRVV